MPRFQFTLRDLFLTTTLIAVGVGGLVWFFKNPSYGMDYVPVAFVSVGIIGAGIGTPFHRKLLGAAIAIAAVIVLGPLFFFG